MVWSEVKSGAVSSVLMSDVPRLRPSKTPPSSITSCAARTSPRSRPVEQISTRRSAFDVPAYGTVDLYLASLDVRVNRRLFTDNEDISGCDRSVDVAIDSERTRVSKLTGERRSVVQESLEVVERRLPAQFQNFFSRPDERVLCNDQPMLSIRRRTF